MNCSSTASSPNFIAFHRNIKPGTGSFVVCSSLMSRIRRSGWRPLESGDAIGVDFDFFSVVSCNPLSERQGRFPRNDMTILCFFRQTQSLHDMVVQESNISKSKGTFFFGIGTAPAGNIDWN